MRKNRFLAVLLVFIMIFSLAACSQSVTTQSETSTIQETETQQADTEAVPESETVIEPDSSQNQDTDTVDTKVLIAFFSRADENYGVGVVEKGNTQIVAEMIAEETGADLFHIQTVTPYPADYDECTEVAKKEQSDNARPELNVQVQDFEGYDVVYLGYPIWWSDMPMAVYTFLESYNFEGKTIIPFSTHAGSGLARTVDSIKESCSQSTVLDGFSVSGADAQNEQDNTKELVTDWLQKVEY